MTTAKGIASFIEKIAPLSLASKGDENGFVWGNPDKKVTTVGVVERPTVEVLEKAVKRQVDLLVIHEPLLQKKKSFLIKSSLLKYPPNLARESLLKRGKLTVYRAHLNLDDAEEGLNTILAKILEIKITKKILYGRIGNIKPRNLNSFANHVKKKLGCDSLLVVGNKTRVVKTAAVVAGGGNALTEIIEYAHRQGAEVLVSGDLQDSQARFAADLGLALIDPGSYYTQKPGMEHLAQLIQKEFPKIKVIFLDPGPPWEYL